MPIYSYFTSKYLFVIIKDKIDMLEHLQQLLHNFFIIEKQKSMLQVIFLLQLQQILYFGDFKMIPQILL